MAVEINGKVYRNLPEQVKKNQDDVENLDVRVTNLEENPLIKIENLEDGEGEYSLQQKANTTGHSKGGTAIGSNSTALGYGDTYTFEFEYRDTYLLLVTIGETVNPNWKDMIACYDGQYKKILGVNTINNTMVIDGTFTGVSTNQQIDVAITNQIALGECSIVEGQYNRAVKDCSHAEGVSTAATGIASHTFGFRTLAEADGTIAAGIGTKAQYTYQTSIGTYNNNKNNTLFEVGNGTDNSNRSNAFEVYKNGHATVGGKTIATCSNLENGTGLDSLNQAGCVASRGSAFAEGADTIASGGASHAEGHGTKASGSASHTEGYYTTASGEYSHSGGIGANTSSPLPEIAFQQDIYDESRYIQNNDVGTGLAPAGGLTAIYPTHFSFGTQSFSDFRARLAVGDTLKVIHSSGTVQTYTVYGLGANGEIIVQGTVSWDPGDTYLKIELKTSILVVYSGTAYGDSSYVSGYHNYALQEYQTVVGKFNNNKSTTLFEVGNGTDNNNRSNAFEVYDDGTIGIPNFNSSNVRIGTKKIKCVNGVLTVID